MRRRDFIGVMASSVLLPATARAQRPPVVGYLANASPAGFAEFLAAFRQGLRELGYAEGQNVKIEYRWAEGHHDLLPAFAADLVSRQVAVIVATGGGAPALVAKAATSTIPIVFTGGTDPVATGLVASLGRPGGNATGVISIANELTTKRLALLRELVPKADVIAVLSNPASPDAAGQLKDILQAAQAVGQRVEVFNVDREDEFEASFAAIVERRAAAIFISADPLFTTRRARLVALTARHRIPASYSFRDFALAGGLTSYGANLLDVHRRAGIYTARILKGEKPADLPVLLPTKFDLVINLRTARALGIEVSASLLALADEVIE
jgi:putative ABC transport system substrate-binding protein